MSKVSNLKVTEVYPLCQSFLNINHLPKKKSEIFYTFSCLLADLTSAISPLIDFLAYNNFFFLFPYLLTEAALPASNLVLLSY